MPLFTKIIQFFTLAAMVVGWCACTKILDAPIPSVNNAVRDSAGNLRTVLAASPYTLFNRAFVKARLDSSFAFYTLFAPSDSAMTAAGLTPAAIDALPIDSLYKFVGYHMVYGIYGDSALNGDTVTARLPTLRVDITEVLSSFGYTGSNYQQYLYLSGRGGIFVNGLPEGQAATSLRASNGIIYPLDRVLQPPLLKIWNIVQSRPELSMYVAANEILDSIYTAQGFFSETVDSIVFDTLSFPYIYYPYPPIFQYSTVLAPTNAAFARAGFQTPDDIRHYAAQFVTSVNTVTFPGPPYSVNYTNYNPLDSVLKAHYLYHYGQSPVFYQDLLYSPVMNDGWLNSNDWWLVAYQSAAQAQLGVIPFYPKFSNQGGTVSIQWSRNPAIPPASLPFSAAKTFLAANGVVYETDQLFYPHN